MLIKQTVFRSLNSKLKGSELLVSQYRLKKTFKGSTNKLTFLTSGGLNEKEFQFFNNYFDNRLKSRPSKQLVIEFDFSDSRTSLRHQFSETSISTSAKDIYYIPTLA